MAGSRFFANTGPYTLAELAKIGECTLAENSQSDLSITDIAALDAATNGQLSFLDNPKYKSQLGDTNASACIVHPDNQSLASSGLALLVTEAPYYAYAKIAAHFYPSALSTANDDSFVDEPIHPSAKIGNNTSIAPGARIGANVTIGDNCSIGPNTVIYPDCTIGDNCTIGANATIMCAELGTNVRIHHGACIGKDGFGFATHNGQHIKVPQIGSVIINDGCDIGANTCIDRGSNGNTTIGLNNIIDNLVQIGHNVQTGRGCIFASQVGISGSTVVGDYVVMAGQVGVGGHIHIADMTQIAGQTGVTRDTQKGEKLGGTPAVPLTQYHRQAIALKRLTEKKK